MKIFPFSLKISALDNFSDTFSNLSSKIDRIGKRISNFGKKVSLGLSAPIAAFGTLAVKKAADFETLRVALETATGSAEAGAEAFAGLADFAATTPFQLEEVVSGFIKLKNRGMDPSREALIAYGNTAGAMGKSLDQMIEAVADASTFEFERLKEFGIKANQQGNKVTFTFRGVKTTVRKDAGEIEEYLKRIGNVDFAGGMEKQSKTIAGAFSNLQDSVSSALDIIGTDIAKTLDLNAKVRGFSDTINSLANAFKALPAPVKDVVVNIGLGLVLVGPLITGIGQIVIGMGLMVALGPQIAVAFGMMAAAAPFALWIAAIGAIIYLFYALSETVGGFGNAILLVGAMITDFLLAPLKFIAGIIAEIWGLFADPPDLLKRFSNGSLTVAAAKQFQAEQDAANRAGPRDGIALAQQNANAAAIRDRAQIDVNFRNPPPGMRTSVSSDTGAAVSVEQGISMGGVY